MKKGLVFGCYDPLHAGHVRLFRACKERCDHLTVCVHDDDYIRRHKNREPLFPVHERVADIEAIIYADEVLINHDRNRNEWVEELGIDIVFVSEEVPGTGYNIPTVRMPRTKGISSSQLR